MADKNKKSRRRVSLFTKYMTFFLSVELVSLVIFGIVIGTFVSYTWEDEQKQKLYDYTSNVAVIYQENAAQLANGDASAVSALSYTLESISAASRADVFITDAGGTVLFCRHQNSDEGENTECAVHSAIRVPGEITTSIIASGAFASKSDLGGLFTSEYFVAASPAGAAERSVATIVFAVQSAEDGLGTYRAKFANKYIIAAFVFMLVTGLIAYLMTYTTTKPLRDMSEATKQFSRGDFSYRIKRYGKNTVREFDELSAAMNSMAESLEVLEESRAKFVANVSHELKTPMTTIGGFIDGILDGTIDDTSKNYYLKIISDEIKRLSRLVVSMLNMSKMEAGEMRINPSQFNLTQQIIGIFMSFEQKIDNKSIRVKGIESLSNIYINADRDMLSQVFYNLIDNAVKFTEKGGDISVEMSSDDENITVVISNTGEGIKDEDIDHIFERFYKGDKSRSLDAKSSGLGLFIAKSIVEYHKGEISVSNADGKYTRFTVNLKVRLSDA